MEFRILGPLEVVQEGRQIEVSGALQRALLACLLLNANKVVSTDRLVDALWEEDAPETARKALQVHVSQLRKALGTDRLETKAPGYRLRASDDELDAVRFERLAREGNAAEALALWRGTPLAEFAYQRFAQPEIARLEELRLGCLEQRIEDDLQAGRHAAVVSELEALVREHPLRERLRGQLMLALYRSGRQAEALDAYQDARRALTDELGIEPSLELKELQRAILAQDPALRLEREVEELEPTVAPPQPPRAPRELRKTVTILFADAVGSTELGEQSDPESVRGALASYFEEMSAVLERHGATVEKFIGDAVMGVFGVPAVHEDDPLRAVRAAIEMREQLAVLNDEIESRWGIRLMIRIGVNTGEVVVGGPGSPTYATGEAVSVAARLQQAAAPGEILLGRETYRFVRHAVEAESVGPVTVMGRAAPLEPMRLLAVAGETARDLGRFSSPMVGRERERRRLHDVFEQAVGDRSCQLFTVLGAAGVGKSRLVQEFLDDLGPEPLVTRGRCLPYGEGISYWPVIEAVRDAAGVDAATSPEAALQRIAAIVGDDQDATAAAHRLGDVIGLSQEASGAEEAFWAVRTFFESLARRRPLVVVFDDIHWGEATFLELVDHIADWTRDVPLLLVCIARPELLEVRPQWGGGKLNVTSVLLEPLSDGESAELLENLTAAVELGDAARRRIVDTAGGNPLFVEEMLALVLEDRGEDGVAVAVPPTIQALLAARLDRLDDAEREAIEAASVEGEVFHEASVAELASADVGDSLRLLVRRELIRPDRSVFFGERAYRFRHLLIRDAAYESIPKVRRATLHEQHAEWLERTAGENALEFEEILGYHLEQAFRCRAELRPVDDDARDLGRRAALRLGAAGRRAFVRSDTPAAVNLTSRAAALLPAEDPARLDLVPNVRVLQGWSGDLGWADQVLREAVEVGDERVRAHALVQRGLLRLFTDADADPEELIEVAESAISSFERDSDELGLARAWRLIAQAHYLARHAGASAEASERALVHARRAGDRLELRETVEWLGVALGFGPVPAPEAARRCEQLLGESAGDAALEVHLRGFLAYLVAIQRRTEEAEELMARAHLQMDELGEGWHFPATAAELALFEDNPAETERRLRPGYEILKSVGERSHFATVATLLARTVYAQARYDEAEALTRESEEACRPNDVECHIHWRGTRAKVLSRRGEHAEAERLAREAIAIAETSDFLSTHGDALVDLGEVLRLAGRTAEAADAVERALEPFQRKGNVLALARTRALLDQLLEAAT